MRWGIVRLTMAVLVPAVAAACGGSDGGGAGSTTLPAPTATTAAPATTTTAPLPTNDQLLGILLTPAEVGPGFSGAPPVGDQRAGDVAARPVCDIKTSDDNQSVPRVSVGPFVTAGNQEQVSERITIEGDPDELLDVIRRRGEARCEFVETASGGISYTIKVDGPVDLGAVGDAAAGFSQTYSKGYEGFRWDMTARKGRLLVNVQYTSTAPVDPARATGLLAAAVAKAAPLA